MMFCTTTEKQNEMTISKINVSETLKSVETLLKSDKSSSPQMKAMMQLLVVIINLLLGKLGLNSENSSIPPSKDPNRSRGSKRKTKGEKKPGGQNGHEGSNLKKFENPDKVETLEIDRRTIPPGDYRVVGFEARQLIDIEVSRVVTEYRAEILEAKDGQRFVATFPKGLTRPIQYAEGVKAQAVYMSQQQLIPYDRVQDYFVDQCGIPISTGTLFNFNSEAFNLLEKFDAIAKRQLINSPLLHADETGINVGGKNIWLHSVSNDNWTLFFPHLRRGGDAMQSMGVLEHFHGVLCHDHWKPYFNFSCLHALCNAHHLRELERAWEQDKQSWAKKMQDLLKEINEAVKAANGSLSKKDAESFRKRYRYILAEGDRECPRQTSNKQTGKRGRVSQSKSRNLLERLRDYETETLRFMTDKQVPFTNNQGENDIRMTKVQQKISGCFRSMDGAKIFCRIRSYLSTCRKQGLPPTEALRILFNGRMPDFIAKLE
jgi:transposase